MIIGCILVYNDEQIMIYNESAVASFNGILGLSSSRQPAKSQNVSLRGK
jgi:hypothetical protein